MLGALIAQSGQPKYAFLVYGCVGIPVAYFGSRIEEAEVEWLSGIVQYDSVSNFDGESGEEVEVSEIERLQQQTQTIVRTEPIFKKILTSIQDLYQLILRNDITLLILFNIGNGILDVDLDQYYYSFKTEVAGISKQQIASILVVYECFNILAVFIFQYWPGKQRDMRQCLLIQNCF